MKKIKSNLFKTMLIMSMFLVNLSLAAEPVPDFKKENEKKVQEYMDLVSKYTGYTNYKISSMESLNNNGEIFSSETSEADGSCNIYFNPLILFDDHLLITYGKNTAENKKIKLVAALVHEVSHCIEGEAVFKGGELSNYIEPNLVRMEMVDIQTYNSTFGIQSLWKEILGDIGFASYLRSSLNKKDADQMILSLVAMRKEYSEKYDDKEHNTYLELIKFVELKDAELFLELSFLERNEKLRASLYQDVKNRKY